MSKPSGWTKNGRISALRLRQWGIRQRGEVELQVKRGYFTSSNRIERRRLFCVPVENDKKVPNLRKSAVWELIQRGPEGDAFWMNIASAVRISSLSFSSFCRPEQRRVILATRVAYADSALLHILFTIAAAADIQSQLVKWNLLESFFVH